MIIEQEFTVDAPDAAEIAAMRGVSERTIQRGWEKGRLYLHHAIGATSPTAANGWTSNASHRS